MKKYNAILLDADGTIFDYDKAERDALQKTLGLYALPMPEKTLRAFREIREQQDARHETGEISVSALHTRLFSQFMQEMGLAPDPMEFASLYTAALEKHIELHEGVLEVCAELCKAIPLYMVTNGLSAVQRPRVSRGPVMPFLTGLFISEEVGFPKPHKYFFDAVCLEIDGPRQDILIVGDSLSADIAGGHAAGIGTCWYNPKESPNPGTLKPDYEIQRFKELLSIVEVSPPAGD